MPLTKLKRIWTFTRTLKGVFSPNITARVLNYAIKGKSVTANFLKPDICFDLTIPEQNGSPINLNPLFRKSTEKTPKKCSCASCRHHIEKRQKQIFIRRFLSYQYQCSLTSTDLENRLFKNKCPYRSRQKQYADYQSNNRWDLCRQSDSPRNTEQQPETQYHSTSRKHPY